MDKEAAEAQNQPDEEGWVTVGRSGRNPAAPRLDPAELEEKRKKKKKVLCHVQVLRVINGYFLLKFHCL